MKRIVVRSGVIAGIFLALVMALTMPLVHKGTLKHSEVLGYTTMVLAFIMVFVGIRSYRETAGGTITFGKAFQVGILITLIACTFYVVSWEIIYYNFLPDFGQRYSAAVVREMHAAGKSEAAIAAKQRELDHFQQLYKNPFFNVGMTFLEIFPVGLIMTLVASGILRRAEPRATERSAVAAG